MNIGRFILAFIVVFIYIFLFEWGFHGYLLHDIYVQTAPLWRTQAEMQSHLYLLVIGQFLFAFFFCLVFLKGYEKRGIGEGVRYGLLIGLLFAPMNLIWYAVTPIPWQLMVYYIVGVIVELIIGGIILAAIYRPKAA